MQDTLTNERFTPKKYITSVKKVLGQIDLDPFSSELANFRIKANSFYTKENSAYDQPWIGKVYANPPYSRGNLPKTTTKIIEEYEMRRMSEGILLVPNWTERTWFQILLEMRLPICFTDHRIPFIDGNTGKIDEGKFKGQILKNPEGGSCFVYFGINKKEFFIEFTKYGYVTNGYT